MDCRKCQTSTASPAEQGGSHVGLAGGPCLGWGVVDQQGFSPMVIEPSSLSSPLLRSLNIMPGLSNGPVRRSPPRPTWLNFRPSSSLSYFASTPYTIPSSQPLVFPIQVKSPFVQH